MLQEQKEALDVESREEVRVLNLVGAELVDVVVELLQDFCVREVELVEVGVGAGLQFGQKHAEQRDPGQQHNALLDVGARHLLVLVLQL